MRVFRVCKRHHFEPTEQCELEFETEEEAEQDIEKGRDYWDVQYLVEYSKVNKGPVGTTFKGIYKKR